MMIVVHDYRGYGFHVNAVATAETVTCLKVSAAIAEAAGELWAKRWD